VVLFERFAQLWLDLHVAQQCEAATYRSYEGLLRTHLLPTMRAWPVTDDVMTPARLANLLGPQLFVKGVKLGNRVSAQRCLSSAFAWGLIFGETRKHLTHNPALGHRRLLRQPTEKRVKRKATPNPMTQRQADALLDWIKTNRREHWEWFLFLIEAGPRVGEVSALKWPSIDLERGKAHIVEAYSASQRWMERKRGDEDGLGEKDTKTHREDQYIDLSTSLVEALQALQVAQRKEAFRCGRKPPQHVFVTSRGTPRRPDSVVRRVFRDACTALKLVGQTGQKFTTHCLRDTFATLKILQGKHPGWVALMLGHETEQTTRERYYKWIRMVEENPLSARR
jgi:integrase